MRAQRAARACGASSAIASAILCEEEEQRDLIRSSQRGPLRGICALVGGTKSSLHLEIVRDTEHMRMQD